LVSKFVVVSQQFLNKTIVVLSYQCPPLRTLSTSLFEAPSGVLARELSTTRRAAMRWGGAAARVSLVSHGASPRGSARFGVVCRARSFGSDGVPTALSSTSARVPFLVGAFAGATAGGLGAYAVIYRFPGGVRDAEVGETPRGVAGADVARNDLQKQSFVAETAEKHPAMSAGWPTGTEDLIHVKSGYVSVWDSRTRNPRWVLERITKDSCDGVGGTRKQSQFVEDDATDAKFTAKLNDYRGSGYDRGHLAAAAGHKNTQHAMDDTFSLVNISPQVGDGFNRDYWARVEKWTRTLAFAAGSDILVCSGPLFLPTPSGTLRELGHSERKQRELALALAGTGGDKNENNQALVALSPSASSTEKEKRPPAGGWEMRYPLLGDAPQLVHVPTHFFKVVVVSDSSSKETKNQKTLVAAFVFPNAPIAKNTPLESFCVPLEKLEAAAGLSFFAQGVLGGTSRDAFLLSERLYFKNRQSSNGRLTNEKINGSVAHACLATSCALQDGWTSANKRGQAR
jgi:endonuclease G|tara:strand:+ start:1801 stop:3336 length:1536 start_codon:yes stop_codon:yes gene_type:complete